MKLALALTLVLALSAHGWEVDMEVATPTSDTEVVVGGPGTFQDAINDAKAWAAKTKKSLSSSLDSLKPNGGDLNLTFKDCGDSSTHAKVTDVTPHSITPGTTTTISGTGTLDEDITDGNFDMKMTGVGGVSLMTCSGDASKAQSCSIKVGPIPIGTMSFEGVTFPVKKGTISGIPKVSVKLPATLPKFATATTTTLHVTTKSGDKVICVEIMTKASSSQTLAATPLPEPKKKHHKKSVGCWVHRHIKHHPLLILAFALLAFVLAAALVTRCLRRRREAALENSLYVPVAPVIGMQAGDEGSANQV